jgi:hypothetical protein
MLSPILITLLSGVAFATMQILFKRNQGATDLPFLLPSWFAFLFPLWLVAFVVGRASGTVPFELGQDALKWPLMWAFCTVSTTTVLAYFLARFSLSEVLGYKKALLTLGALLADVLIFKTAIALPTLGAIGLILAAATLLSRVRAQLPSARQVVILCAWCVLLTAQISFYKQGQGYQPYVLSYTIVAQLMATGLYSLLWLLPVVRRQQLGLWRVAPVLGCVLVAVLLEGYGYANLPLAVVMLLTMVPATLFAVHDLWHGDLPRSGRTWLALGMLAAGFALLILKPLLS